MTPATPEPLITLRLTDGCLADASGMADLINRAYRGETSRVGWTTEADILDGVRTTPSQLQAQLSHAHIHFLLAWQETQLVGCICLEHLNHSAEAQHATQSQENKVQLGMIAVEPQLQNQGIGKWLIAQAEAWACTHWSVKASQMSVIHLREPLIAFYQRLGYIPTNEYRDFPVAPQLWQPKVADLKLRVLRKTFA